MKTELQKTHSELQRKINALREKCTTYTNACTLRKRQITQFNLLIKKLLTEGRITKQEVHEFIIKKAG
jgi:hypothetical protein